jgi:hypothetical protein
MQKLGVTAIVSSCLGSEFATNNWFFPADGTRGRVLLACKDVGFQFHNVSVRNYTVTISVSSRSSPASWSLTGVYGPQEDFDKRLFITELWDLKQHVQPAWHVLGDFNLIYQDSTRSTTISTYDLCPNLDGPLIIRRFMKSSS